MVFNSAIFIFLFFPCVILVNYFLPAKFRNIWLFLASIVFYSWGGLQYTLLVFVMTTINYFIALFLGSAEDNIEKRKIFMIVGVCIQLGILIFFKYSNFLLSIVNEISSQFGLIFSWPELNIPLPLGISFIVFQMLSYLGDVYFKKIPPEKNFFRLLLYIFMFPEIISGPILRYSDMQPQIIERQVTTNDLYIGIQRFIVGFGKKMLLSGQFGYIADTITDDPAHYSTVGNWIGIIAYSLQLYFDFSGYSDMAIGLGKMMGFTFMENFNYPYISKSIQEFWRRWHISLSSWFRDYVYIPLGGSRVATWKIYRNLIIVFLLTGIWHGASFNFIIWGLWSGIFLVLERLFLGKILKKIPAFFSHLYALVVIMIGWVFFRMPGLSSALSFGKYLFNFDMTGWTYYFKLFDYEVLFFFIFGILFCAPLVPYLKSKVVQLKEETITRKLISAAYNLGLLIIFFISILYMVGGSFVSFIYLRF